MKTWDFMGYVDNKNVGEKSTDRVKITSYSLIKKKKNLNKTNSENTWLSMPAALTTEAACTHAQASHCSFTWLVWFSFVLLCKKKT